MNINEKKFEQLLKIPKSTDPVDKKWGTEKDYSNSIKYYLQLYVDKKINLDMLKIIRNKLSCLSLPHMLKGIDDYDIDVDDRDNINFVRTKMELFIHETLITMRSLDYYCHNAITVDDNIYWKCIECEKIHNHCYNIEIWPACPDREDSGFCCSKVVCKKKCFDELGKHWTGSYIYYD